MSETADISLIQGGRMHGPLANAAFGGASGKGSLVNIILDHGFNPGVLRPYVDDDGASCITVNGQPIVTNAAATLRKDEWLHIDGAVLDVAKPRLKINNWLRTKGLVYNLPNAMGHPVFMSEKSSDISPASISMDALASADNDRPLFDSDLVPVPIVSKTLQWNARELAASRNGNTPLDTTKVTKATRRVVEGLESLSLGTAGSFAYGGGNAYGLLNTPLSTSATFTDPVTGGWVPKTLYNQVATMVETILNKNQEAPLKLWYSTGLIATMMTLFNDNDPTPLAAKLAQMEGISSVERCPGMTGKRIVICAESVDVIRLIFGMDVTTLQWEQSGGLLLNMIVMGIMVPQIRQDYDSQTGLINAVPG